MKKIVSGFKALVCLIVLTLCYGVWAATPIALFTGDDLVDGKTIGGVTLDLNGNAVEGGVVTIGSTPVFVNGVTGSSASIVVKYLGAISSTDFIVATVRSPGYSDVVGVWASNDNKLHGVWANNDWSSGTVVNDATLPSDAETSHSFCLTYGDTVGTTLLIDGVSKYAAGTLKAGGQTPTGFAIGGSRKTPSIKSAATGMKIESILVLSEVMPAAQYNAYINHPTTETSATIAEDTTKASLYDYGAFLSTLDFVSAENTLTLTDVPALGGKTIRVQDAADLAPGAYTLIEWTGLMGTGNRGYGHPALDLCGADETNIRLLPMVGKVVLLKTDPAKLTRKPYKIWCVGDSITEGYNSTGNCANYRVQLATKLAVEGYNVKFVGQYTHRSKYASGEWAADEWSWHSGVSGQRMWTRGSVGPNRLAGYVEAIDAAMYQVPNADVICFLLGTNDFGAGESGEVVFNGWKLIVKKLLARYPNTKIVVSPCVDMHEGGKNARGAVFKGLMEAALAGTDDTFTTEELARLVNARLDTYVTGSGAPNFEDGYHPTWDGHNLMSLGWYDAIVNNNLISKTDEPTEDIDRSSASRGAEANVDPSYLNGFTKVRTLAIPEEVAYALNEKPAYTEDAEAPEAIRKVAYYMELVRKESGEVRYVWVDMDAFGATLDEMLVPTGANVQRKVQNLHIASNMGSITPVAANVNGVEGYLEFSPYTATPAATEGAPAALWSAMDWNDTLGTSGNGRGSMQVSRIKSEGYNAAELLFAWNNWGAANTGADGTKAGEIGIGDFPQHYMADTSAGNSVASLINAKYPGANIALNDTCVSSDYTTTRFSPWGDTMNAKAYSVRTLEVWVDASEADVIYIPAGETYETSASEPLTKPVTGEGRLVLDGYLPTNDAILTSLQNGETWTGTVEIKNYTKATNDSFGIVNFNLYGNAGSTIALNGVKTTMYSGANGFVDQNLGTLEIMDGGWTSWDGQFTDNSPLFNCNLTGTGAITINHRGAGNVIFCGDHSGFKGAINFASNADKGVVLAPAGTGRATRGVTARQVMIHADTTTSLKSSTNGTIVGAGTLVFDGAMPQTLNLQNVAWTGLAWLKNVTTKANYSATLLGNAGSTVRYTNVSGWFATAMKFDGTIDIVNDESGRGLTLNDGSSGWANDKVVRFGHLTGAGTLNLAWNKTYPLHLPDVDGFTGSITCAQANGIGVIIGTEATIEQGGAGKIAVLEGVEATIGANATWTAPNGVVVNGALSVDGTLQNAVTGSGRLGYTKFNKVHATVKTSLQQAETWTGTLVITNDTAVNEGTVSGAAYTTLNEFGSVASKIELAGNCSGFFGLSTKNAGDTPVVVQPELVVSGTWSQNSGYSQAERSKAYSTIFRKISGTGTMSSPSGKPNHLYYIEDASAFKGVLEAISGKFVIGARTGDTFITNGTITISEGETISAGLTWKASAGITFAGVADFESQPTAGDLVLANGVQAGVAAIAETAAYSVGGAAEASFALALDGARIVLTQKTETYGEVTEETPLEKIIVGLTTELKAKLVAANVTARAIALWAVRKGGLDEGAAIGGENAINLEAFALDCTPAELKDAKANFKIVILFGEDGVPYARPTDGSSFGIQPTIRGKVNLKDEEWVEITPENKNSIKFFRAFIDL